MAVQNQNQTSSGSDEDNSIIWEIPSILVPSTRMLVEEFGGDIIHLEGATSSGEKEKEDLDVTGTDVIGFDEKRKGLEYVHEAQYEVLKQRQIRTNGLGGPSGEELIEALDEKLGVVVGNDGTRHPGDAPVRELVLEFDSDVIQRQLSTNTNCFRALYSSHQAEERGEYWEETGELLGERGLIKQNFHRRNLNLLSFSEVGGSRPIIKWTGENDISPSYNNSVAALIHNHHHPQRYSRLKEYTVGSDSKAIIK